MSYRGRVVRRQPVSCSIRPQSIQEQKEQFNYLACILGVPQFNFQTFPLWDAWLLYMQDNLVPVMDVDPDWMGPEDALAMRLPVGPGFILDIWLKDVSGTVIPSGQRVGFLYLTQGGVVKDDTVPWGEGTTVPADTACRLTCVTSPDRPVYSLCLGVVSQIVAGDATYAQPVRTCWFVHPFFSGILLTNDQPSQVVMVQPRA